MAFSKISQFNKSDLNNVQSDINDFKNDFINILGSDPNDFAAIGGEINEINQNQLVDLYERVQELIDQLQDMITELSDRSEVIHLDKSEAIQISSTVSILQTELENLLKSLEIIAAKLEVESQKDRESYFGRQYRKVKRMVAGIKSYLKPRIISISQRLWRLISNLLTPKEWSIGGEIGHSLFFVGKVKMEIKFGS